MQQNFTSIPFKTESGLSQIEGIGKFSSAGIVLEFESKLFGLIKGGVKEIRLPLAELLDLKFRKGFFKRWARIEIRLKSFAKLSELPSSDGKITLKLQRDDFERARDAVEQMQSSLSEHHESLPPAHASVSRLFIDNADTKDLEEKN